jgi:hypothetical protein
MDHKLFLHRLDESPKGDTTKCGAQIAWDFSRENAHFHSWEDLAEGNGLMDFLSHPARHIFSLCRSDTNLVKVLFRDDAQELAARGIITVYTRLDPSEKHERGLQMGRKVMEYLLGREDG